MFELWKIQHSQDAVHVEFCGNFPSVRSALVVLVDSRPGSQEGDCEYQITDTSGKVLVQVTHLVQGSK